MGAVIGTEENKENYINDKIREWTKEINMLADIATTYPQAAYKIYVTSYQQKLVYLLRTNPNIEDQLKKVNEAVRHKLIFAETSENEYKDSRRITSNLQTQALRTNNNEGKTRDEIKAEHQKRNQEKFQQFLTTSDEKTKRMMETLNQKEVSNWLTNLPMNKLEYELTKQEFSDAIKIRCNWPLDKIPSQCICGASFGVAHALSCKNGSFITLRYSEVRHITSELLDEVYINVRKEPILQEANNEDLPREANKNKEVRLDISALNFWTTGQRAFFDVVIWQLRANENEKKRSYGDRVLQIENRPFTPLVFAVNGRLAEAIADKRKVPISIVSNNIRTLIWFSLLRSTIRCLKCSRNPKYSHTKGIDIKTNALIKID